MRFSTLFATGSKIQALMAQLKAQNAMPKAQIALVLCTPQLSPTEVATELNAYLGPIPWVGCYSPFISLAEQATEQGLALYLISDSDLKWGFGMTTQLTSQALKAGELAMRMALDNLKPSSSKLFNLVFLDSSFTEPEKLLQGCVKEAGSGHLWAGMMMSKSLKQAGCFALGKFFPHSVIILSFLCPETAQAQREYHWTALPQSFRVTQTVPHLELDYQSAYELYRTFLPPQTAFEDFLLTHPIGLPLLNGSHMLRFLKLSPEKELYSEIPISLGSNVHILEPQSGQTLRPLQDTALGFRSEALEPQSFKQLLNCQSYAEIQSSKWGLPYLQMGTQQVIAF